MKVGKFQIRGNWGHIIFVSLLVGYIVWYFFDSFFASSRISNLLLILPATVAAVILYVMVLFTEVKISRIDRNEQLSPRTRKDKSDQKALLKKWIYAVAMALFLFFIPVIGFELSCFLFMSGMVRLLGARSWKIYILYPVIFSVVTSYIFIVLLNVSLKSLIF